MATSLRLGLQTTIEWQNGGLGAQDFIIKNGKKFFIRKIFLKQNGLNFIVSILIP